jgi:hypothetical protein
VVKGETGAIKQALESGQLSVTDATGYRRYIHAPCPKDRSASPVLRHERAGQPITRLVFRCPVCGTQFEGRLRSLYLL